MTLDSIDRAKIVEIKYAYLRHLDLKNFQALGLLLTENCTASYENGNLAFDGRDAIVQFLNNSLGAPNIITQHTVHHPELSANAKGMVRGIFYLHDRVIVPDVGIEISGTAIYDDVFVCPKGEWRIAHTGYERIFEERRSHSTYELQSFKSHFNGDFT